MKILNNVKLLKAKIIIKKKLQVCEIVKALDLKVYSGASGLNREVKGGYSSDLMSDVLANAVKGDIWVTVHNHKNTVAIASLKEISAIVIVKDIMPSDDTLQQSDTEGLPILGTSMRTFDLVGKLYNLLEH